MALSRGIEAIASRLQEAVTSLSQDDIRARLRDELNDKLGGKEYCDLCDVYGDDESGECVYYLNGDYRRAAYTMGSLDGKAASCDIDTENSTTVVPRTTWEEEADDDDHMNAMMEAALYTKPIAYERFIGKAERDKADKGSFAGKGKSFPILKAGDVEAAVHAMGRAGAENHSASTLKSNIIRIAKAKGFGGKLPKAWQGGGNSKEKEARTQQSEQNDVVLIEHAAAFCQDIPLSEAARTDYPIKLIQPGWGSSGYYPAPVLERDGPNVFKAGTQMFWNHATDAEESARPEGDLNHLAAVTTSDAYWDGHGKEGAGLYARAKVFADYAEKIAEKAPHTGLSIRAAGKAKAGEAEGRKGVIIEALTHGDSVDFVTRAGAGGKVLTEAARFAVNNSTEGVADIMADDSLKELKESFAALKAEHQRLKERALIQDAAAPISEYFATVRVPQAIETRVKRNLIERFIANGVPIKDGAMDTEAIKKLTEGETKDICAFAESIAPTGSVRGLGAPVNTDPKEAAKQFTEDNSKVMDELAVFMMGEGESRKTLREAFKTGRAA